MSYLGKHRSYRGQTGRARTKLLAGVVAVAAVPTVFAGAIMLSGGSASGGDDSRPASTVSDDGADGDASPSATPTAALDPGVSPTDTSVPGDVTTTPESTTRRTTQAAQVTTTRAAATEQAPPSKTKPQTTKKPPVTEEPPHTSAKPDPPTTKDEPTPGDTPTP